MSSDIENFVSSPSLEVINILKKANLLVIVQHYELSVNESMSKAQIKKSIVQYLQDEELLLNIVIQGKQQAKKNWN